MTDYFFIAGAQRSGTTYLYKLLYEHPEINMATPIKPEPKFFLLDKLYCQGKDFYNKNYFSAKKFEKIRGEKSTSYIESEKVASRIFGFHAKSKIIFVLRNPIHRAISNYNFSVDNFLEPLGVEDAFRSEINRLRCDDNYSSSVSPYAYLKRGVYIDYLSFYFKYFPRKQIKIVLYEELIGSFNKIKEIYEFLQVNKEYRPLGIRKVVNSSKTRESERTIPRELLSYMKEYYSKPNNSLAEQLGLDLSVWE